MDLFDEMALAGVEAMREERARGASETDTVKAVYMAMQAILEVAVMQCGRVH
jgi:hypothetical protein